MSKLILHKSIGRINIGLNMNEEVQYKESIDSVRIIDTFYVGFRNHDKSYVKEF